MYCMALKVYTFQEAASGAKTFLNIFCKLLQQNEHSPAWQWPWFQYQLTLIYSTVGPPTFLRSAVNCTLDSGHWEGRQCDLSGPISRRLLLIEIIGFIEWSYIGCTIDISWVDYPYMTTPTCDVMYCRQRRHLYYGGDNLNYYLPPPPQFSLHKRAALITNSNGTQPAHKGKG
jgi:hypothetical protein